MKEITRNQIAALEDQLLSGIKTSDVAVLDKMLHDDLLFITPDGTTVTKAMDLASHQAGTMVVKSVVPQLEAVNFIGDTAIVVIVYDTSGSLMGTPISGKFRYIRFWKQFSDGWKVIGGSCTAV